MNMKTHALREMDDTQLELTLRDTQQQLFRLRLQSETERLEAPTEIIKARRAVARILTVQREREIARARPKS
jgi:large subunit ribosomal protein L29